MNFVFAASISAFCANAGTSVTMIARTLVSTILSMTLVLLFDRLKHSIGADRRPISSA
jgi:hypothetical protein